MKFNFIEAHSSKFVDKICCVVILLLALFMLRPNVFFMINEKIIGGASGDSGLYYYLAKSFIRNFTSVSFFQTSMYYPYGYTLAWSDNFILPSAFINFLNLFFSFNASYNLCFIFTWILNGFCCFLLLYLLTGSKVYSILPSTLFCINSSLCFLVGHPQLQFVFFIPLGIYYFLKYIIYQKKSYTYILGFIIFLTFITAVYYAVFLCFIIFFIGISLLVLKPKYILRFKLIFNFIKGTLLGISPLLLCVFPYINVKKAFSVRAFYEAYAFSSTLLSYFSGSPFSVLYSNFHFSHSESLSFVGFVPLLSLILCTFTISKGSKLFKRFLFIFFVLFLIGSILTEFILPTNYYAYASSIFLWSAYLVLFLMMNKLKNLEYNENFYILSNRGLVLTFLFLLTSLIFLSFGPLGSEVTKVIPTGLYTVMYYIFPGVNAIRAIGRVGIVVILVMYILFSLNFYLLSKHKKYLTYIFVLLCIFNFYEEKVSFFQMQPSISFNKYAHINKVINKLPKNKTLIYLPMQDYDSKTEDITYANVNVSYMINSLNHNHSIVNGYSGQRGRTAKSYPDKMKNFPDERSINTLTYNYNLKYIVYDGNLNKKFNKDEFEKKVESLSTRLKVITKKNNIYLIKYIGSFENRSSYSLSVPKYLKKIKIQIKTKNSPRDRNDKVIMVKNDNNDTYVDSISPIQDGKWHTYQIDLTKTVCNNLITPYRLSFVGISSKQKIYIKNYD